jgi:hypothetical protein
VFEDEAGFGVDDGWVRGEVVEDEVAQGIWGGCGDVQQIVVGAAHVVQRQYAG